MNLQIKIMKKLEKFTSSTGLKNKRRVFLKYIKFGVPTILIVAIIVGLIGIYVKDSFELRARLTFLPELESGLSSGWGLNINLEGGTGTLIYDSYSGVESDLLNPSHQLIYSELDSKYNAVFKQKEFGRNLFKIVSDIDIAVFLYDFIYNDKNEYSFDYLNDDRSRSCSI